MRNPSDVLNLTQKRTLLRGVGLALGLLLLCLTTASLKAASATVYANDFESYPDAATSLLDEADANPTGSEWMIIDDTPVGGAAGSGVQVINWLAHSGTKALLFRSGTEAQIHFPNPRSGYRYQMDFWLYVHKETGDRNFYLIPRGEGADFNGSDYIAYQSHRGATAGIDYYDGVANNNTGAWMDTGATHTEDTWQHHRLVIDPNTLKMDMYLDNMDTPVASGLDLARCEVALPTMIRLLHEGNSADDGYFVMDDFSLTVEGSIDLSTTFREGFENYPARINADDDADPQGPWITTETDGTGTGRALAPGKVQVVDGASGIIARTGGKCLKIEGGQRAGASVAWGAPPETDVQVTWWALVPESVVGSVGTEFNYLRMSLYGAENGNNFSGGDDALLGYGIRSATVGDGTSLTYYTNTTGWLDTGVNYTPNVWEEYQLTTDTAKGQYTIVKNPSGTNPEVVVAGVSMIGTATNWAPVFMAAWSSSNGTNHPPVYVDDITIKARTAGLETLCEKDFENYTAVASSFEDEADADPTGAEWIMTDDAAFNPTTAGAGVQVINWQSRSAPQALLLRSGTTADVSLDSLVSSARYQLDFWLYNHKAPGNRGFRVTVRGAGGDQNLDDYFAYGSVQSTDNFIRYYDGVDNTPVGGLWVTTAVTFAEDTWQHHRVVMDAVNRKMTLYIDDMTTPVLENVDLGRSDVPVPVGIRFQHEGDNADDGYFVVDDVLFRADMTGTRDLSTPFIEDFESYTARSGETDDANPGLPWITVECVGAGAGRIPAPERVQVVDDSVVKARSGNKCLKLEGGHRASITFAWGVPPQADVQITWWARVPASSVGGEYNYLRMSLYGAENGNMLYGDCALLGYGCRNATVGTATSLTYYTNTPGWLVTGVDFTPETWEEYQLTTHNADGRYTIIKDPSGDNPVVVVDRAYFIGSSTTWGPNFMAAWSSSNGAGHPPVYIDDITIKAVTAEVPAFSITSVMRVATGVQLTWEALGSAKYDVLRGTDIANAASFEPVATDLTTTTFIDTRPPTSGAYYRVVAKP